jgi:2-polyprenyl-3-methyl-5-hydroxy-6-metoxy-1,4-benzoquinol methylase
MDYYSSYSSALDIDLDCVESFKTIKDFILNKNSFKPSILDIGCGLGYLSSYLSDSANVTALDINPEIIKRASRLYKNVNFLNLDAAGENIHETWKKMPENKFDFIVCNNIVEHLEDRSRKNLFYNINTSLLKNNGIVIFGYADPYHPVQLVWGFLTQKVLFDKTHVHNWSTKTFKNSIIKENFEIIDTKRTSPFTKFIFLGKHFKGDILIFCRKKNTNVI